MENKKRKKT